MDPKKNITERLKGKPLKVLIIEDSQYDADLLIVTLKKDFTPIHRRIETAEECRAALQKENWEVILADYNLPLFSAPEALTLLHQTGKDIPFIIVSGAIGEESAVELLRQGAHDFISKFNLSRLNTAINREIENALNRRERKRVEEAVHASEKRFREIFENASDGLLVIDNETMQFYFGNSTICKMLGYAQIDIVKLSVPDIHPQSDLPFVISQLEKKKRNEIGIAKDIPIKRKDGSVFYTDINSFEIIYQGRKCLIGIFRDITDRMFAEKALRDSEERYRRFFEDDLTGDYIANAAGQILECNPAFLRIFAFKSKKEALNYSAFNLHSNPDHRKRLIERLVKERKIESYEVELRRVDGKPVYVVENLTGEFDDKGELVAIRGYIFDDTRRKVLERQLIHSQKMESLGTLAGGIAHDFNNILGIIMGHASLINMFKADPDKMNASVEAITRATERGAGLVRQLLTFAHKTDVMLKSVRINDIVGELTKMLNETFTKKIQIKTQIEKHLPTITADQNQLHSVLLNLCVNARDAMAEGGTITITTKTISATSLSKHNNLTSDNYVAIEISDTGKGMDQATLDRIFEPFFTTKESGRGTGLGLAVAYGIIERHNGFIEVESELGKGTVFHIYLPVQPAYIEMTDGVAEVLQDVRGGNETILFVEDEEFLAESTKTILEDKGYKVITAYDGVEALEIYSSGKENISLVLSDLGLPRIDGQELFNCLKKINPAIKFVIASGFIQPDRRTAMSDTGVKDFIQKPYAPSDMLRRIRNVLDKQ